MVAKLGEIFYQEANAPIAGALQSMRQAKIEQAIAALDGARLLASFRAGAERAAKIAGVSSLRVFRLLDMDGDDVLVQRLGLCQRVALTQWRSHDSLDGGLFSDSAMLGEGEVPDVARGFRRIAETLKREAAVSSALTALADAVEHWAQALDQARAQVESAPELARGYRRRRMVKAASVTVLVLLALGAGTWLTQLFMARARIDAHIRQISCPIEPLDPADEARASGAQQAAMSAARDACRKEREEAARVAEKRRQAEQRRLKKDKDAKEQRERCAGLGRNFKAGKLDEADNKEAGKHAALLQRLIDGRLELDDVSETKGPLPCSDGATGKAIRRAYAELVVSKMLKWIQVRLPSELAVDSMVESKDALPNYERKLLAGHIEMMAKYAVRSGESADIERHATLCRFALRIEDKKGVNCIAVLALAK
jgi:hypothetical protein